MSIAIDNSDTNHAVFLNDVVGVENQYNQVSNGSSSPSLQFFVPIQHQSVY